MKVRCINARKLPICEDSYLTLVEVYKVIKEDKRSYKIITNNGMQVLYNKERFEIVEEDNEMQEKTFREVITDIKEREVWICEKFNRKIIKGDDGVIEIRKLNDETFDNISAILFRDEIYMLQRKQYSFEEAFKAYEDGKEIESCCSKFKFFKNEDDSFDADEIRGKWYINN